MIRLMRTLALLVLSAVLLAGCARMWDPLALKTRSVTADDSGAEVALAHGQRLFVRLPSKPDSGYEWKLFEPMIGVVKAEGAPQSGTDTELWTFTPVRDGEQALRFEYRRPRDYDAAPAGVVAYQVSVK